ncbi:MAG: T9SS type A sorting domain-containing protein [Bacteroidia bacterium]
MKKIYTFSNQLFLALAVVIIAGSFNSVIAQPDPIVPIANCNISADSVMSYNPKKRKDGSEIPAQFANPANALGTPTDSDIPGPVNFAALGFGGDITLRLSAPIADAKGNDFEVVETSYNTVCRRYPETAQVFVSQDNCNFVYLGIACHNQQFDLSGSGLDWIQYVRIHDVSRIESPQFDFATANGYDVDGIKCLHGIIAENPVLNNVFVSGVPRTAINYLPTDPQTIAENRRIPENATGIPEGGNGSPVTFTSLGFGGEITLIFDYTVFDQEGPDLFVTETSGSANYPERAQFFGSLTGDDWVELGNTEDGFTLYQDGWIDFDGQLYGLNYLRIVDRTARSQFGSGADGYDVDGVEAINTLNCSTSEESAARKSAIEYGVIDELPSADVYPNPFSDILKVSMFGSLANENVNVSIFSVDGREMSRSMFTTGTSEKNEFVIPVNGLSKGIYLIEINSVNGKFTRRIVKN